MRQIEHTNELKVGQQIAWVYPPREGANLGPLAGRVESITDGDVRIDRGDGKFSVFFEGNCGVTVFVLEEAPEFTYEVPGEAMAELFDILSKPRDTKGYKTEVVKAAEVVALHARIQQFKP